MPLDQEEPTPRKNGKVSERNSKHINVAEPDDPIYHLGSVIGGRHVPKQNDNSKRGRE